MIRGMAVTQRKRSSLPPRLHSRFGRIAKREEISGPEKV